MGDAAEFDASSKIDTISHFVVGLDERPCSFTIARRFFQEIIDCLAIPLQFPYFNNFHA